MLRQHRPTLSRVVFLDMNSFSYEEFTNGATIQYREIFRRLMNRGLECAVITVAYGALSPRWSHSKKDDVQRICTILAGIPVIEYLLPQTAEQGIDPYRATIKRALAEFVPDLIIINTPPSRLLEEEIVLAEEIAKWGSPVFCFIPDDHFPKFKHYDALRYHHYQKCISNFRAMCPSQFIANRVSGNLCEKVELMPNLFTVEDIVSTNWAGKYVTLINPHPIKGIRVFEAIAQQMPDVPFLAVQGWPYPPKYETKLRNVEVVPFRRDMRSIWKQTKVLLVPSLCNEGYGRVVVEAMLNGIPVIAHNIGGLPEASAGAAILIDPPPIGGSDVIPEIESTELDRLVEAHLKALRSLLTNEAIYKDFSSQARKTAMLIHEKAEESFEQIMKDFIMDTSDSRVHGGTVVLSPHPDDAALSLGGILHKNILRHPISLLTVFGQSNYLRESGFQADCTEVTFQRKNEDIAFASCIGIKLTYLELPEASLRLGSSFDKIFTEKMQTDVPIPVELMIALQQILDEIKPTYLFVPLGLGGHHDHLLLQKMAREIARALNMLVVYYEDLPYAAELSDESVLEQISSVDPELCPTYIPIASELTQKLNALRLYRSQIGSEELEAVKQYAFHWNGTEPAERIWSSVFPLEFLSVV